jgi:hypothetical protein
MRLPLFVSLALCLAGAGAPLLATVTNIEYYFDSDPGPGNGAQVYARSPVDIGAVIGTSALEPGIHRLYVRARSDEGLWGLPQGSVFLIPSEAPALQERTVSGIEYYFDADPGPGNGIQVYGRNSVELDQLIATAALEPGIHRLFVRPRDDEGLWGLPRGSIFYIPLDAPALQDRTVSGIEYYFDADPGPGNGIQVYGRNNVELDQLIATSTLDPGLHRLFVRSRNDLGSWGLPQSATFLVPFQARPGTEVTQLEYFIDTDPGFGNGTVLDLTPGQSASASFPVTVGAIEHGNHCLYLRTRNGEGSWGFPVCCEFSDGIPAGLTVTIANGMITLSWEDLPGIDTYKVYSAPLPSGAYSEDGSGAFGESDWSAPLEGAKKFYRVTSIYQERD